MRIGVARSHVVQAPTHRILEIAVAEQPLRRVVEHQVFDRPADDDEPRRVAEQLEVALIPGHEPQLGVDDAHTLRQMFQRGTQQLAVELNDLRCLVEKPDDLFELHVPPPKHRGHHQARARCAKRARQQVLRKAQQLGVGALVGLERGTIGA